MCWRSRPSRAFMRAAVTSGSSQDRSTRRPPILHGWLAGGSLFACSFRVARRARRPARPWASPRSHASLDEVIDGRPSARGTFSTMITGMPCPLTSDPSSAYAAVLASRAVRWRAPTRPSPTRTGRNGRSSAGRRSQEGLSRVASSPGPCRCRPERPAGRTRRALIRSEPARPLARVSTVLSPRDDGSSSALIDPGRPTMMAAGSWRPPNPSYKPIEPLSRRRVEHLDRLCRHADSLRRGRQAVAP